MSLVRQSVSESVSVSVKFRVHGTYCPSVSQSTTYDVSHAQPSIEPFFALLHHPPKLLIPAHQTRAGRPPTTSLTPTITAI